MKLLEFMRKQSCNEKPKLQCIMTTHSPNLASKASLDSLILMTKGGKAFSLRKNETELDPDDYVYLEKFLDVTKSNLFFAKAVVLVEGDGENILLPTIAKILERPLEDYGVSIVNIGSTAFSRFAKIFQRKDMNEPTNGDSWIPIPVACLRDLDLWPDRAAKRDEADQIGFKERRERNISYWLSSYETSDRLNDKKIEKMNNQGQKVKVFLSDEWTFEYSLIVSGLDEDIYSILYEADPSINYPTTDKEEKSIYLYKIIEEGKQKTKVAYLLSKTLLEKYNKDSLRENLPSYLVQAIEYVTEPLPVKDSKDDGNEDA
jgi:putative ATP-dependent endonuclease of OLD family